MQRQNFQEKNRLIRDSFVQKGKKDPERFSPKLKFSWSNWGFGLEELEDSITRLHRYEIDFIELHGNRYGEDLGYKASHVNSVLSDHGMKVGGICGMFSAENDLSSNRPIIRQNAIDYIRRNLDLASEVGASYFLIVPGAVGRPAKYDDMEFARSVETLQIVAPEFEKRGIRGAVEPIRSAEVSFCHTFADAKAYIKAVGSPGIQHINGDVYHMQSEESHIGETIAQAGEMLTNLHLADSQRGALGSGSLDLDTIIMALYLIDYTTDQKCFVTPEPLGPGGDPYPAMYGKPDQEQLDAMVRESVRYFRSREEAVRSLLS